MAPTGIYPAFEAFYIEAMLWHTTAAVRSAAVVSDWLRLVEAGDEGALALSKGELFGRLQDVLHQAGCLSRYFFPSRKLPVHVARAAKLCAALGVQAGNPLEERGLRDALEHFDERLDHYLAAPRVGQFVPDHVGYDEPRSEVPRHVFKGFYTRSLTFTLLGERYEMAPIVDEVHRLHGLLTTASASGGRLPRSPVD